MTPEPLLRWRESKLALPESPSSLNAYPVEKICTTALPARRASVSSEVLRSRSASGGLPSAGRSLVCASRDQSPEARISRITENAERGMRTSASIVDGGEGLHTVVHSRTMEPQYLESVTRLYEYEVPSSAITFSHTSDSMRSLLAYLV